MSGIRFTTGSIRCRTICNLCRIDLNLSGELELTRVEPSVRLILVRLIIQVLTCPLVRLALNVVFLTCSTISRTMPVIPRKNGVGYYTVRTNPRDTFTFRLFKILSNFSHFDTAFSQRNEGVTPVQQSH